MRGWRRQLIVSISVTLVWSGTAGSVADPSMTNGTTYSVIESEIGGNGQIQANSNSYSRWATRRRRITKVARGSMPRRNRV
jgi:hypothetical protein